MAFLTIIALLALLISSASRLDRITDKSARKIIIKYLRDRGYEVFYLERDWGPNYSRWISTKDYVYRAEIPMEDRSLSRWLIVCPVFLALLSDRYLRFVEIPPQTIQPDEFDKKKSTKLDWWDHEMGGSM